MIKSLISGRIKKANTEMNIGTKLTFLIDSVEYHYLYITFDVILYEFDSLSSQSYLL